MGNGTQSRPLRHRGRLNRRGRKAVGRLREETDAELRARIKAGGGRGVFTRTVVPIYGPSDAFKRLRGGAR